MSNDGLTHITKIKIKEIIEISKKRAQNIHNLFKEDCVANKERKRKRENASRSVPIRLFAGPYAAVEVTFFNRGVASAVPGS